MDDPLRYQYAPPVTPPGLAPDERRPYGLYRQIGIEEEDFHAVLLDRKATSK